MEGKSETHFSPDLSSTFSFSFAFEFEGGTAPSGVAEVPSSSGSTALLGSSHPAPSYVFSFSFELEGDTDAYHFAAVPTSSAFFLSFAFEVEGGTAPCSVAVVPPSSDSIAFLISIHPVPSSGFSFSF